MHEEFEAVDNALTVSGRYNLQVEVILDAMRYLKSNPDASIREALNAGMLEWDI